MCGDVAFFFDHLHVQCGQKKCAIDQWPKHITVVIQAQKVMSSYTVSNYWPHCVQRKLPVFNLLRGRF